MIDSLEAVPPAMVAGEVVACQVTSSQGWMMGTLLGADGTTRIPFVGRDLSGCGVGCQVRLTGHWQKHPTHDWQFAAIDAISELPTTPDAIRRYVVEHVPGCGPVRAQQLVSHFGPATLDVLATTPARVTEVFGSGARARAIQAAWAAWATDYHVHAAAHRLTVQLMSAGMTYRLARRLIAHCGSERAAHALVLQAPYQLTDVAGIGFRQADLIARANGIGVADPLRCAAGVRHAVRQAMQRGHTGVPRDLLERRAARELRTAADLVPGVAITAAVDRALAAGTLVHECGLIYLPAVQATEQALARQVAALAREAPPLPAAWEACIAPVLQAHPLSPSQLAAVRFALQSGVSLLTGRPGTGKTTTLQACLRAATALGWQTWLLAPTGKAAARAAEVTGHPAMTIHRALGGTPTLPVLTAIPVDFVVVDESSMMDLDLAAWLVRACVPGRTRLLLVGDHHQLPPVAHGQVFEDLLAARTLPAVELTEIHRQAEGSQIARNASLLLQGQPMELENGPRSDCLFADVTEEVIRRGSDGFPLDVDPDRPAREAQALLQRLRRALQYLRTDRRADPQRDIQVLSPMRKGALGVDALNRWLQAEVNAQGHEGPWVGGDARVRVGDRVLQTRNDYDVPGGWFNGEQGVVCAVDTQHASVTVRLDDGRLVAVHGARLLHLRLAWAVTIHRAQGSEYPFVIALYSTSHWSMLDPRLLYTALTRARRQFILLGTQAALTQTRRAQRRGLVRHTGLVVRCRACPPGPGTSLASDGRGEGAPDPSHG